LKTVWHLSGEQDLRYSRFLRQVSRRLSRQKWSFGNCPICEALLDMRDLTQVLVHVHDAEMEIGEGPEPPARDGPLL